MSRINITRKYIHSAKMDKEKSENAGNALNYQSEKMESQ